MAVMVALVTPSLCAASIASADEAPVEPTAVHTESRLDGARIRVGFAFEAGTWTEAAGFVEQPNPQIASTTSPYFGLQLELGVQVDRHWGVYAVPSCGLALGDFSGATGGIMCEIAVMADYTLLDGLLSIGAGPEIGQDLWIGTSGDDVDTYTLVGGRGRIALHVLDSGSQGGSRRRGFEVGLDAHLLDGIGGKGGLDQYGSTFIFSPRLTVGYSAF